jgi:hypothetical protein
MPSNTSTYAADYLKTAGLTPGSSVVRPAGPGQVTINNVLETGRQIRDQQLWQFNILPEAVLLFQQLSSSREWAVSGRPRQAARTVEWLNSARSVDPQNGQTFYGFQQYLQRRALDAVVVGRTAFYCPLGDGYLEYLDPTALRFVRDKLSYGAKIESPSPREFVWQYFNHRALRAGEVFLDHMLPIGTSYFLPPIVSVLKIARLAWLLTEHDSAKLDGRKIREIFIVSNEALGSGIEDAILKQAAIWAGADASQLGIPVVSINNPSGTSVANLIHTMGISNLPENFDRQGFIDAYVNQIAAALGMALRQFWNNEKTTNRALEEVQEQRQQQKGPNLFVKTEEKLINNSGILDRFGTGRYRVRFGFIEETDLTSRIANADVLKKTAEALATVNAVFKQTISLESYLAWMQNLNILPYELELNAVDTSNSPHIVPEASTETTPDETRETGSPALSSFDNLEKMIRELEDGNVVLNQHGEVLDRRRKHFSVLHILTQIETLEQSQIEALPADEEAFQAALKVANAAVRAAFRVNYEAAQTQITEWRQHQILVSPTTIDSAIRKALADEELLPVEQDVLDAMMRYLELNV